MNNTPKKVIVTGCSGQDGSYMVDYLLANTPHLVYGMVRRTAKPDLSNLELSINNPRFQLVTGDLSDTTSIDNVVRQIKPDYFINFGAQSFVASSWTTPEQTIDVTGLGVVRCLEAVRKHVPACRYYSAGSSEQWGDVAYTPQDEKHPMRPRSPYGCAKCLASLVTKVYRESYGLFCIHGILTNHESERRGEEFVTRKITLGVARIVSAIKNNQSPEPIRCGNLDAKRDWSHAADFIDGIWKMLNQETPNEYVLSSGETHTVREFIEKAFTAAGALRLEWVKPGKPEEEYLKAAFHINGYTQTHTVVGINPAFYRPAEVELLLGDSSRARAELGWSPKISFDQLVSDMVKHDLKAQGIDL